MKIEKFEILDLEASVVNTVNKTDKDDEDDKSINSEEKEATLDIASVLVKKPVWWT